MIGIGATDELNLRVSVATLVRVIFEHPKHGTKMLALDRRANLRERGAGIAFEVKAQPFGGAIRIHDIRRLQKLLGDFHFDSEESRSEQDFRLYIRPAAWEQIVVFCLEHFNDNSSAILEHGPQRELGEEFAETLGVQLKSDQYTYQVAGTILEGHPSPTDNFYARDFPTVRIYRIFEAQIWDAALAHALVTNSESISDNDLRDLAWKDAQAGGQGWASAALTLPFHSLNSFYETVLPDARNQTVLFQGYQLDETVAAILENVAVPKYQRL
jgi:hypothetical protein